MKVLEVTPEEITLIGIGTRHRLKAMGTYTDGSTEDLTRKVQYTANDESVVEVSPNWRQKVSKSFWMLAFPYASTIAIFWLAPVAAT